MNLRQMVLVLAGAFLSLPLLAQYQQEPQAEDSTVVLTLDDALKIALSENVSVKVADMEIQRAKYAKKGSYGALFPQINASGLYSYAIQKQKVYFGSDKASDDEGESKGGGMASMMGAMMDPIYYYIQQLMALHPTAQIPPYQAPQKEESSSGSDAVEMGRSNQVQFGISASMPLVNVQLWESLRISGEQVELAVEQARESRLGMVTSVKQAFYAVLLARAAYDVYNATYENAVENFKQTERKYNVNKASEMDMTRAKASLAAAVPNLFNAENTIELSLWQLKAVLGVDLDMKIDVAGKLEDYAEDMLRSVNDGAEAELDRNSPMRQLAIQADMLASQIRMQQYAYIPSLAMQVSYNYYTQSDVFQLSQWKWLPSSTLALSLSIPIFSGFQRYHAIKQTRVQKDELDLQRQNAERQLKIAIRQNISAMDTQMKSYEAARDALESAEKAYDIASKSYEVGRSTLTDLNNTELVLTQTRLQALQAIYNFVLAKAALEQNLGYDFLDDKGNVDLEGSYLKNKE